MKKNIILLLLFLLPMVAGAQIKFGYLSYGEAIKSMPDYAMSQKNLASLRAQYDNEIKRAEEEFNLKYEAFLEGQGTFAPAILKKRQAELQELLNKNLSFKREADRLLRQAEDDMYAPLHTRLNAILAKIGGERGYAFILNTDNNTLPYVSSDSGEDINTLVKDALNRQ